MNVDKLINDLDELVVIARNAENIGVSKWLSLNSSVADVKEVLEKEIPKKPIIKPWNAASCPCCGVDLSESLGDGYYKHWPILKFCNCGQRLDWD